MIPIKILTKPKGGSTAVPTAGGRGGSAMGSRPVLDAEHARRADAADLADHARSAGTAAYASGADKAKHADAAHDIDTDSPAYGRFLRKDVPDRAARKITFGEGADFGDFARGATGASVFADKEGGWHMEADYLDIRRKLTAREVEIMKTGHIGGRVLLSPASATITRVVKGLNYFICSYPKKDADGNERTADFRQGDLAYCETFNLVKRGDTAGNHFYWRLVLGVSETGDDFAVFLSDTDGDKAAGSTPPKAGDKIVALGNRTELTRQNAIILGGAGSGSPFISAFKGVNTFALPEPVAHISPAGSWITVDDGAGRTVKIQDALTAIMNSLSAVRQQNDEQMCLWFGEGEPTLDNFPASDWTTDETRAEHIKDIYYDRSDRTGGRAYSFEDVDGEFVWDNITDADVLASLERARHAQDTADGKRRVFVAEPQGPYDVGDLWVNARYPESGPVKVYDKIYSPDNPLYDNDILRCKSGRVDGFSIFDWSPAQKMTTAEFESQIRQTASTIDLSVTKRVEDGVNGMRTELEAAGVHIDGVNSRITLKADTTEVSDDLVVNKVKSKATGEDGNPLIHVDGSTGAAFFAGKVTVLGSVSSPFTVIDDGNVEAMGRIVTDDPYNLGGKTLLLDWRKSGFSVMWEVTEDKVRRLTQIPGEPAAAPKILLPTDGGLVGAEFEVYNRSTYSLMFTADVTLDVDVPANTCIPTSLVEPDTYTRYKFMYLPMKIDGSCVYAPGWVGFRRLDLRTGKK